MNLLANYVNFRKEAEIVTSGQNNPVLTLNSESCKEYAQEKGMGFDVLTKSLIHLDVYTV